MLGKAWKEEIGGILMRLDVNDIRNINSPIFGGLLCCMYIGIGVFARFLYLSVVNTQLAFHRFRDAAALVKKNIVKLTGDLKRLVRMYINFHDFFALS